MGSGAVPGGRPQAGCAMLAAFPLLARESLTMHVTFPHANNFQFSRGIFIAAWKVWFKRFSEQPEAWREGRIPRREADAKLAERLQQGARFSVDVIARLMVPWPYRDTLQASDEFVRLNPALLRSCSWTDDSSGEQLPGARLTDQALDYWDSLSFVAQEMYLIYAEARVQADIETPSDEPVIVDDAGACVIGEDIYPPVVPAKDAPDRAYVHALAEWIAKTPYQPMYQRQNVGDPVSSWHDRLQRFFWPKPRIGFSAFNFITDSLLYRARLLARSVEENRAWTVEENFLAVKIANEIFNLYGVPQRDVTPENVRKVVSAALEADGTARAKMNSGWTWLAAYATAHRENDAKALSICGWNSRVAAALVSRLDFLLVEAGHTELGNRFPQLGTVPGWGGTRPRPLTLQWPSGYRNWATQIAVSEIARDIRDYLNQTVRSDGRLRYKPMPTASGELVPWTVMGVCQVLMGDGY